MKKKFYITTPIYYVNDIPHIGHAYTTIAADILARWHRLKGEKVFFLTGTDEHGAKIAQAAQKKNVTAQAMCDENSGQFKTAWKNLNISNDSFIRTTERRHEDTVKLILKKLFDEQFIYKKKYEGLYCVPCEKFLSEEDLDEGGCCPDHKQKPVKHSEENYFFKLSKYSDELLEILSNEAHPSHYGVFPLERRNEITGKIKKTGLDDISISRASIEWGIPLPFDEKQTVYVWVDALINYVSGIGYSSDKHSFDEFWPCDVHLMAKDILWFHSVIWPAMLLAAGLPLPKKMFAHGFFTIDGQKMSKTIGNVISPAELIQKFGVDASRYLSISLFPFGIDGDISWKALTDRYNVDLANNLGNLVSRTFSMAEKYFEGKVPQAVSGLTPLAKEVKQALDAVDAHFDKCEFHLALEKYQAAINIANRFVQDKAPWKMAKENNPELPAVIYSLLQSIGLIAVYLNPVMPETSAKIWELLGEDKKVNDIAASVIDSTSPAKFPAAGRVLGKPGIMFPRFDNKK